MCREWKGTGLQMGQGPGKQDLLEAPSPLYSAASEPSPLSTLLHQDCCCVIRPFGEGSALLSRCLLGGFVSFIDVTRGLVGNSMTRKQA